MRIPVREKFPFMIINVNLLINRCRLTMMQRCLSGYLSSVRRRSPWRLRATRIRHPHRHHRRCRSLDAILGSKRLLLRPPPRQNPGVFTPMHRWHRLPWIPSVESTGSVSRIKIMKFDILFNQISLIHIKSYRYILIAVHKCLLMI